MKRILFILCIITSSLLFSSCQTEVNTSADIVVSNRWAVTTPAGISAVLSFDKPDCTATFELTDYDGSWYMIEGMFAIDPANLYITSEALGKTYIFGYKSYNDRLELEYNDTVLTLNATDKN